MSVPKVKCPSCGTEWVGPVVFCGECGAVITASPSGAPGDRVARVPPAPSEPPPSLTMGETPKPPAQPVSGVGAGKSSGKQASAAKGGEAPRATRPSDLETRRTVTGMPAVTVPVLEPARPSRRDGAPGGRKGRKGSVQISTAHEDTDKMLEALDAGFESITRPSEVPVIPITPSVVPDVPVTMGEWVTMGETPKPVVSAEVAPLVPEPAIIPTPAPVLTGAEAAPSVEPVPGLSETDAPLAAPPPVRDEAALLAQHESDMAEVRALFTEMAVPHARPLRDFMIEVSWGDPTREWLDVAAPASAALRRAADALEMPDLGEALDGFTAALELAAGEAVIAGDAKDLLLGAYAKLRELMPAAFALDGERGRREPIIVRSLLLQVPGVHKIALDKLYAAGLTSLDMIYAAGPRELAETTGLDVEIAARIHDRFQRYRREATQVDPGKDRAAERSELLSALAELSRAHDEHERLTRAWSGDAAAGRAQARKERGDTLLRINVILARLGEVDRLKALEKVPFAQKIRDLQAYLDEAKRKAPRP